MVFVESASCSSNWFLFTTPLPRMYDSSSPRTIDLLRHHFRPRYLPPCTYVAWWNQSRNIWGNYQAAIIQPSRHEDMCTYVVELAEGRVVLILVEKDEEGEKEEKTHQSSVELQ